MHFEILCVSAFPLKYDTGWLGEWKKNKVPKKNWLLDTFQQNSIIIIKFKTQIHELTIQTTETKTTQSILDWNYGFYISVKIIYE